MNIYWDTQNHVLIESLDSGQRIQRLDWILRDHISLELYLVTPKTDDQGYDVNALASGKVIRFAIKVDSSGYGGQPLAYCYTWTPAGSGDTQRYVGTINLNTTAMIAAHTGGKNTRLQLDCKAEFCFRDSANADWDSTQIDCRITEDVNRDGDAAPASASPWFEEYTDPDTGELCIRLVNSNGQTLATFSPTGA